MTPLSQRGMVCTEGTLPCCPGSGMARGTTGPIPYKVSVWPLNLLLILPFLLFSALVFPYLSRGNDFKTVFPGLDFDYLKNKIGPLFMCRLHFYKPLILVQQATEAAKTQILIFTSPPLLILPTEKKKKKI